jgi:hypothetical protein
MARTSFATLRFCLRQWCMVLVARQRPTPTIARGDMRIPPLVLRPPHPARQGVLDRVLMHDDVSGAVEVVERQVGAGLGALTSQPSGLACKFGAFLGVLWEGAWLFALHTRVASGTALTTLSGAHVERFVERLVDHACLRVHA